LFLALCLFKLFVYDLRMIGRIFVCRVSVVETLLQPMKACVFYETKGDLQRK
jgi:hypothetical protein